MKRKTKKAVEQECMNYVAQPPWTKFKTKQEAYSGGFNAGIEKELFNKRQEIEKKEQLLNNQEREQRLKALSNICQAGSEVVMSMSKALLAFERVL